MTTIYGDLDRAIGRGRYKVVALLNQTGPPSGPPSVPPPPPPPEPLEPIPWTIDTGLNTIVGLSVSVRTEPNVDETMYKVVYDVSGGIITIKVYQMTATNLTWTEVTGDRSGFSVDVIAIGY